MFPLRLAPPKLPISRVGLCRVPDIRAGEPEDTPGRVLAGPLGRLPVKGTKYREAGVRREAVRALNLHDVD